MKTTSMPLLISLIAAGACSAALARNSSGFSGDGSWSRSGAGTRSAEPARTYSPPASAPRAPSFSTPAPTTFSRPESTPRSAASYTPRTFSPPSVQSAPPPAARSAPGWSQSPSRVAQAAAQPPAAPSRSVSVPQPVAPRPSAPPVTYTPGTSWKPSERTAPAAPPPPRVNLPNTDARNAGTERGSPVTSGGGGFTPPPAPRTFDSGASRSGAGTWTRSPSASGTAPSGAGAAGQGLSRSGAGTWTRSPSVPASGTDTAGQGVSRGDLGRINGAAWQNRPAVPEAPARAPDTARSGVSTWTPSPSAAGSVRDRSADNAARRFTRFEPITTASLASPSRAGARSLASRGENGAPPAPLSLRSNRGPLASEWGADAGQRNPVRAPLPGAAPSVTQPPRWGEGSTLFRPPYGASDRSHQPSPRSGNPYSSWRPPYHDSGHGSHHGGHHDGHHGGHHGGHHYPYYYGSYACSPVWWGPVVYPAGFGLTWHSDNFCLSIATYAPAYTYTRYYDSWCGGGWGYSGVYYGGWRHGWYGGFSYVYNPWPVYRTYYLYDPYPVTETVYVTQPAATTTVITEPAPAYAPPAATAPASYAAPATAAAAPSAWDSAPAVLQAETAAATCFCPCRCNGFRPCTCDYPCGAEYALRDQDVDLSFAFRSYADTLSPEMIWSSYSGLDRWDDSGSSPSYAAESAAAQTGGTL